MSRRNSTKIKERSITESLREYGRGVAGGLMFSLPLLYTMEVWWAGFNTSLPAASLCIDNVPFVTWLQSICGFKARCEYDGSRNRRRRRNGHRSFSGSPGSLSFGAYYLRDANQ